MRTVTNPAARGIGRVSLVLAGAGLVILLILMVAEAVARYLFAMPLGWNVSAVERVLMPATVFLALPWMYLTASHVSAGMVYDRLPAGAQRAARAITCVIVLICAAGLLVAGAMGVASAFAHGDTPPPGSSDIPLPTWIWTSLQPLGALGLLVVALIDAPRFLRESEPEQPEDLEVEA